MKIIILTGGIATGKIISLIDLLGKSTIIEHLKEKGYEIIDAEKIARELVEIGKEGYKNIISEFGTTILNEDLTIDRKKLATLIFNSENLRIKLNNCTHYLIRRKIVFLIIKNFLFFKSIIILDIPYFLNPIYINGPMLIF